MFPVEKPLAVGALKLQGNSSPFKKQILQNAKLGAKRANMWRWKFIKDSMILVNEGHI